MNHLESRHIELIRDVFAGGPFKTLIADCGSKELQALYQSGLIQGFLHGLKMPEEDKHILMAKGANEGMIIEEWWPEFLAIPIEGVGLTSTTLETFKEMSERNLCIPNGDFVGWFTGDMLFVGEYDRAAMAQPKNT